MGNHLKITKDLVNSLIEEQFPQYQNLDIEAVKFSGIDNRTYRLGKEMLIRLPSAECYAPQVLKEQTWLPKLALHLSTTIPTPLHTGNPNNDYPWHWSIYKWIPGTSANQINLSADSLKQLAKDLAQFIRELHQAPTQGAPEGGQHNFHRGCHLSVYDEDTRRYIKQLQGIIDTQKALETWEIALSSCWEKAPIWVHGDMASGNLLIKDSRLNAVIDFGCMGTGDPACDLVISWTLLDSESRAIFQEEVGLDTETWNRARGWALWKDCFKRVSAQKGFKHQ